MTITRLEDNPPNTTATILGYGGSGTGKTEFALSAGSRTLYADTGQGIATKYSKGFIKRKGIVNPLYRNITENHGKRGFFETATLFDEVCDFFDEGLEKYKDDFDTVVLDDMTAFRRGGMNKALELGAASRNSQTLGYAKQHKVWLADVGDYAVEMDLTLKFLSAYIEIFKEANKNFIVLAHERHMYGKPKKMGDEPPLLRIKPGFTAKSNPDMYDGLFDEIYHFYTLKQGDNSIFRIHTLPDAVITAKTRWGMPNNTQNVTFQVVRDCIDDAIKSGKVGV